MGNGGFDARDCGGENDQLGYCVRPTVVTELGIEWKFGQKSTISANGEVTTPEPTVGSTWGIERWIRTSELEAMPLYSTAGE